MKTHPLKYTLSVRYNKGYYSIYFYNKVKSKLDYIVTYPCIESLLNISRLNCVPNLTESALLTKSFSVDSLKNYMACNEMLYDRKTYFELPSGIVKTFGFIDNDIKFQEYLKN